MQKGARKSGANFHYEAQNANQPPEMHFDMPNPGCAHPKMALKLLVFQNWRAKVAPKSAQKWRKIPL